MVPQKHGCRICGNDKLKGRGLCEKHYRRFLTKMDSFDDPALAEEFEQKCIADGWVTKRSKGGRPKERDPFDEIADLVIEGKLQAAEAKSRYESENQRRTSNPPRKARTTKKKPG